LRALATAWITALCERLAPDQRDVVLLRIVADMTVDDVAIVLLNLKRVLRRSMFDPVSTPRTVGPIRPLPPRRSQVCSLASRAATGHYVRRGGGDSHSARR
jgi:hypothetical protein